jgi:hypothetical protein
MYEVIKHLDVEQSGKLDFASLKYYDNYYYYSPRVKYSANGKVHKSFPMCLINRSGRQSASAST